MSLNNRFRVSQPPRSAIASATVNGAEVSSVQINYWDHYASIADRINPIRYGTDRHRPAGPCTHNNVVAKVTTSTVDLTAQDSNHIVLYNFPQDLLSQMWPLDSTRNQLEFNGWLNLLSRFEDTPTYRNLCVSAFNKQITQVPPKTSVINFALELLELKPIFKSLAEIPKSIKDGSVGRSVSLRKLSRRAPINTVKKGANALLALEFQWLPFVSDISAFIGTMDSITKRLDFLRKTKGKETTIHFRKEDAFERPLGIVHSHNSGRDAYCDIWLTDYQCDFVSTWKLFQDLEGLDDAWAGLRAAFAYLGVNNPAKIVWNAIPFSFLVDWVTPVSSWLNQVAVQPFYGVWKTYDVTSSVREKYRFVDKFHSRYGGFDGEMFRVDIDSYRRLNYLPLTAGDVDFTQLTDTQQKLAAALVITHRR